MPRLQLTLIDARSPSPIIEEIESQGFDLDEGVVLKVGGKYYAGATAMKALAEISSDASWYGRLNRWIFQPGHRARLIYPLLRSARGVLLKLLGRPKINTAKPRGKIE